MYVPDPFALHDRAAVGTLRNAGGPEAQGVAALMESPALDP